MATFNKCELRVCGSELLFIQQLNYLDLCLRNLFVFMGFLGLVGAIWWQQQHAADHSAATAKAAAGKKCYGVMSEALELLQADEKRLTTQDLKRALQLAIRRLSGVDKTQNTAPISILITHHERSTLEALNRSIVATFNAAQNSAVSSCADIRVLNVNETIDKRALEAEVEKAFVETPPGRRRLLVLNGVDRLSGTTPLFLHGLADNENAPYESLVILATAQGEWRRWRRR